MLHRTSRIVLAVALAAASTTACSPSRPEATDRWTTTENTNVKIDWDKVNDAYKHAEGPADLERRINEIYEGDEVVSIAVHDTDAKTQVVTGFFDKNTDGKVDEPEKIFTITRVITGEGEGQYQTAGYGHYAGYTSPMFGMVSGMLMGSMLASMMMPRPALRETFAPILYVFRYAGLEEAIALQNDLHRALSFHLLQ